MILRYFCLLTVLISSVAANAQWDSYEAQWEGKPGLMIVQMELYDHAPYRELPYLTVLTQGTLECDEQGFPSTAFISASEGLIELIDSTLDSRMYIENAGRLIYQCEVRDYFYVQDTSIALNYIKNEARGIVGYEFVIDPDWKVYADFIYPDEFLQQTMINGRILKTLEKEGYLPKEKKRLAHFASFLTLEDLHDYRRFLIGLNYKIGDITEAEEDAFPHQITFSRKDKLALDKLSNTTLRLHQRAKSLEGLYQGWEIEIE